MIWVKLNTVWFLLPTIIFEIYPGKYYLVFGFLCFRKEFEWDKNEV